MQPLRDRPKYRVGPCTPVPAGAAIQIVGEAGRDLIQKLPDLAEREDIENGELDITGAPNVMSSHRHP
jgi:hypothetical protein